MTVPVLRFMQITTSNKLICYCYFSHVVSNLLIAAHSCASSGCPLMQRSWEICVCSFGIAVNYASLRASTHQRVVKD
jgi:hypothetical protein